MLPRRKPLVPINRSPPLGEVRHFYALSFTEPDPRIRRLFYRRLKRKRSISTEYEKFMKLMARKLRMVKNRKTHNRTVQQMLDEIIPTEVFGNTSNRKRFYKVVNRILIQPRDGDFIPNGCLSEGYDMTAIKWLKNEKDRESRLRVMNKNILRYIVKPLILHYYYPFKHIKTYQLEFVERKLWYSFMKRSYNNLIRSGHIKLPDYIMAKKHSRGRLMIFPKSGWEELDYRPIIFFTKNKYSRSCLRALSKKIYELAATYSNISTCTYKKWENYTSTTMEKAVFGIKLDIKDAFGNVNVETVCKLINENNIFDTNDKQFFIKYITNQYVYFNKRVCKWNHGVLQGDPLSPSINNLYLSYMEKHFIRKEIELSERNFLCRHVDDYFFCSTNRDDVKKFEEIIRKVFIVNNQKTQKVMDLHQPSATVTFCGQNFNLRTFEVSRSFYFNEEIPIRYLFRLRNLKSFFAVRYNNHNLKQFELNTTLNSERTVLINFFRAMLFVALKFDYVMKANVRHNPQAVRRLSKIIESFSTYALKKIKKFKGKRYSGNITPCLLKHISYRAFHLVLKRSGNFYEDIIKWLKKKCRDPLNLKCLNLDPTYFLYLPTEFLKVNLSWKSKI